MTDARKEDKGHAMADTTGYFVHKSEKLATAIYMITDVMSEREPLRWKIREEAMEILSLTSSSVSDTTSRWNVLYRITQAIDRIEHILTLAKNAKLMSDMNVTIVRKEYLELKEKITNAWSTTHHDSGPRLDHRFFRVDTLPTPRSQPIVRSVATEARPLASDASVAENVRSSDPVVNAEGAHVMPTTLETLPSRLHPSTEVVDDREKKSDRRAAIIELVKAKRDVSVSDVMRILPDVSDKTIQRELVSMVESGVLVKRGEKRWSTYSLRTQ